MEFLKIKVDPKELGRLGRQAQCSGEYFDAVDKSVRGHLDSVDFPEQEDERRRAYEGYRFDRDVLESLQGRGTVRLRRVAGGSSRPELEIEPSEGGIVWVDPDARGRGKLTTRLLDILYQGRAPERSLIRQALQGGQVVVFQT